jgi:chromate transporter
MGLFFSKVACVTFGGAYSVLAYVTQHAVQSKGWLTTPDMMVGLSMAETTPGPLIMVLQFVGFLGAYNTDTGLHPVLAGVVASCVVVHATFAPCFLWIFAGAPYVETLRQNKKLTAALSTITAAVVGVVLNLTIWFAIHALFGVVNDRTYGPVHLPVPDVSTLDYASLVIALVALVLIFRFKMNMILTLLICCALGIVWTLAR